MDGATLRGWAAALLLGAASATYAAPAAKAPEPGPNDACLGCHGDAAAKNAAGKPIAVDAAKFGASVHGEMQLQCTSCHADVSADKFPHDPIKPAACASCHEKAVKEYEGTIHGRARAQGKSVAATCANCHGAHDIKRSKEAASRTHHDNLEATCGSCHGSEAVIAKGKIPGGNVVAKYHDSIHGKAIAKKGSTKDAAPTCTNCHGAHDMRPKADPESRVARAKIPDTCGSCHMNVKATWEKSMHGKLRASHVMVAPGCTDCHSAHAIQDHTLPKWQVDVIEECGNCHTDYIKTYRDTFHGQVTDLGFARMATCASCHGAHEVLPKSDPASKVSDQNRLATCKACHPKANANFALFEPHANKRSKESGVVLYYTALFMQLLLAGVFATFGLHTVLWLYRSLKERAKARAGGAEGKEKT